MCTPGWAIEQYIAFHPPRLAPRTGLQNEILSPVCLLHFLLTPLLIPKNTTHVDGGGGSGGKFARQNRRDRCGPLQHVFLPSARSAPANTRAASIALHYCFTCVRYPHLTLTLFSTYLFASLTLDSRWIGQRGHMLLPPRGLGGMPLCFRATA
ncbi:hypothetical protein GQ54DRAFT_209491 [Martensiomyces pterosporus]|nr:hypothetical protein GQ54DRAFT_209491 [Martensiomyces pterosporus]